MKNNTANYFRFLSAMIMLAVILLIVSAATAQTPFHAFVKAHGGDGTYASNVKALARVNAVQGTAYTTFYEMYTTHAPINNVAHAARIIERDEFYASVTLVPVSLVNIDANLETTTQIPCVDVVQPRYTPKKIGRFLRFDGNNFYQDNKRVGLLESAEETLIYVKNGVYYEPADVYLDVSRKLLRKAYEERTSSSISASR